MQALEIGAKTREQEREMPEVMKLSIERYMGEDGSLWHGSRCLCARLDDKHIASRICCEYGRLDGFTGQEPWSGKSA